MHFRVMIGWGGGQKVRVCYIGLGQCYITLLKNVTVMFYINFYSNSQHIVQIMKSGCVGEVGV